MKRALLLGALAVLTTAPAVAQDAKPLREARTVPLGPTPLEQAKAPLEALTHLLPPTAKLIPRTRGTVRLAVLLVELADTKRPRWERQSYEDMLFSKGQFTRDPDGQPVHGSVRDYYLEQSARSLDVTGKVFDWVSVPANRKDLETKKQYLPGAKRGVIDAALDRLLAREGPQALDAYDGLGFLVAGDSSVAWGTVLWPHSSVVLHRGKAWRYYLSDAGGSEQGGAAPGRPVFPTIGVHAHEIGHVLGLPDEYGLQGGGSGIYCLMAVGNNGGATHFVDPRTPTTSPWDALQKEVKEKTGELRGQIEKLLRPGAPLAPLAPSRDREDNEDHERSELFCLTPRANYATAARPLHICAPCKAALGWVKPVALKPGQRVYLEPIEDHPKDVIALPLGGSRRLLLEYRAQRGFDAGLPRSGLLAWRTGDLLGVTRDTLALGANGALLPAHGVSSVDAAAREGVLWPWKEKAAFEHGGVKVEKIEERDGRLYLEIAR